MFQPESDYENLTRIVERAIDARQQIKPSFSTTGHKIDDIVSEKRLRRINPNIVVEVAAMYGFDIMVCRYGEKVKEHEAPQVRANGKWLPMPNELSNYFTAGGRYSKLQDDCICPTCAGKYKSKILALKQNPEPVQPMYRDPSFHLT